MNAKTRSRVFKQHHRPASKLLPVLATLMLGWGLGPGSVQAQDDGDAPAGPPPVVVAVSAAKEDRYAENLWVPGTVISRNDARIAAEATGRVTWVAEVGTRVKSGQPLARIDDATLQLELADAEARIRSLEANHGYQQNQLQRLNKLQASNNASATQIDEAESQLEISTQAIAQARVARAQVQRRIELSRVLAPFDGQVVERLVQLGEFVNPGAPVARLVDVDNKEIRVRAPLAVAPYLQEGMQVSVQSGGQSAWASINNLVPVGDDRSRMFELRLAVGEEGKPSPLWIIGAAVRVGLPNSDYRRLVAIPRDALVMRGGDMFVYRIEDGDKAARVDVATGIGIGELVEVIGDIAHGDELVVRGAERLQPGQTITRMNKAP